MKKRKRYLWLSLLQIVAALLMFPAFFNTMGFLATQTPEEIYAQYGKTLPSSWSGAIMSHGKLTQGWPIEERPVFFGLSLVTLIACLGFIYWSIYFMWRQKRQGDKDVELEKTI